MDLAGRMALVVGTGVSGMAAARLLDAKGAKVLLFDENADASVERVKKDAPAGVGLCVGELSDDAIGGLDIAVVSPGVPMDSQLAVRLKRAGVPIWGELELAYRFDEGKVVAITGTNGKTTTTALIGEIMGRLPSRRVFVVGNIGIPYTSVVGDTNRESITVAEVSSFQLETVDAFRPEVGVILNLTPDHLDRHHTMEGYAAAKKRITKNQSKEQVLILNYEDGALRGMADETAARIVYFSSVRALEEGVYLDGDGNIACKQGGETVILCHTSELQVVGVHMYEDVMAGVAAGMSMGVPLEAIREAVMRFRAIPHRIEYVAERDGVTYYNDSKATNTDAAIKGVQAMAAPTWLIGGGYDKGAEYGGWIDSFAGGVKGLVLFGQTKDKIADEAKKRGFHQCVLVDGLEQAVRYCRQHAEAGDAVLLSPACASWDMFANYEERGDRFKQYVME